MNQASAIRVGLANGYYLVRNGISCMLHAHPLFLQTFSVHHEKDLMQILIRTKIDVLVLDAFSTGFSQHTFSILKEFASHIPVLHISNAPDRNSLTECMKAGIHNHILAQCDEQEVEEALIATASRKHFLCGKVAEILHGKQGISNCNGVVLTEREREIIAMIAEGLSNKEIADKLFLSTHTVNTHRKNIMNKLEVNNTAGLVMYAVREQILSPNHFLFS
jgi:DNA-binding NarL/FixJ family response regulator